MSHHHERFLPDLRVSKDEVSLLRYAENLETGPYYDWTEAPWPWLMASQEGREEIIADFTGRVYISTLLDNVTVELPEELVSDQKVDPETSSG